MRWNKNNKIEKEITVYELLGLMKNNKQPKKIKFRYKVYDYDSTEKDYRESNGLFLFGNFTRVYHNLDETIEIVDEKFEDIKECAPLCNDITIVSTINKLIRNQKKIIEGLNKKK